MAELVVLTAEKQRGGRRSETTKAAWDVTTMAVFSGGRQVDGAGKHLPRARRAPGKT